MQQEKMNIVNITTEPNSVATKILFDGIEPKYKIRSFKLEQEAGEAPILTLEIYGGFDINVGNCKVEYKEVKNDN